MRPASPEIASALTVLLAGVFVLAFYDLGRHSTHMALHIALMNIIAPLVASAAVKSVSRVGLMWGAVFAQLALLWMWHVPAMHGWAMQSLAAQIVMHASLFAAALWFWSAVLRLPGAKRWQAIPALLVTGKLVCLLSALIIFSPRLIYAGVAGHHHASALPALDDQQLAGLLMITACPLSYIIVGIFFAARLLYPTQEPRVRYRRAPAR